MLLRNQLKKTAKQIAKASPNDQLTDAEAYFGLPEEIAKPVNIEVNEEDEEIGNYLQQLHLKNHTTTSKEVVHDLFIKVEETTEIDGLLLSSEDEMLFEELCEAVTEKDILDLRSNIKSIAQSVPAYAYSLEEIEDLVNGELEDDLAKLIGEEAMINAALSQEIMLQGEINSAVAESDIMKLRAKLTGIMENEFSHSRSVDEIDNYLIDEMDDSSRSLFEGELISNAGLAAEVDFHKELQMAVGETEVMSLRGDLHQISRDGAGTKLRILGTVSPARKLIFWSAAASIAVLIAFSSLLQPKSLTEQELYASYYQPYNNGDNVSRSASTTSANVMSAALHEIDRGDYATALNMLKIASADKQSGFAASFYSGKAYQALGDYRNAIKSFGEVIAQGDNLLVEQSQWYIGLCYLKMNEKDWAVRQFSSIASGNGYYSQKSSELLKQLR